MKRFDTMPAVDTMLVSLVVILDDVVGGQRFYVCRVHQMFQEVEVKVQEEGEEFWLVHGWCLEGGLPLYGVPWTSN